MKKITEALGNLLSFDFSNPQTGKFVTYLLSFVALVLMLFYVLLVPGENTRKLPPDPAKEKIIATSTDNADLIVVQREDGTKYIESSDYRISESEARKRLGIPDDEVIEYYIPAVAGPRPDTSKEDEEKENEKWGLSDEY